MKRFERLSGFVVALSTLVTVSAGCTYSPDIRSGSLECSNDGQCPRGFTCSFVSNICCQNGDLTCGTPVVVNDGGANDIVTHFDVRLDVGTGGTGPTTGGGGASGAAGQGGIVLGTLAGYRGTWTFGSGASVHTTCDSGNIDDTSLAGTSLIIEPSTSGSSPVTGIWDEWTVCTYGLNVDAAGVHLDDFSWQCSSTDAHQTTSTWIAESFEVTTADGHTATHTAVYDREDDYANGDSELCTQTVTATLTKK